MGTKPWECGDDEYLSEEDRVGLEEFQRKVDGSDEAEWKEVYTDSETDYKVWTQVNEASPVLMVKSQMTVNASNLEVFKWMAEVDNFTTVMPELDEQNKYVELLETVDPKHYVVYGQFRTPPPLTHRDFVWKSCCTKASGDIFSVLARSVDHEAKPPEAESLMMSHVRGVIGYSGWHMKKLGESKCLATYVVQCDPKGWVPATAFNFFATRQGANVQRLAKHFAQE